MGAPLWTRPQDISGACRVRGSGCTDGRRLSGECRCVRGRQGEGGVERVPLQERDLVDGRVIRFLNLLDRGFRGKMASWKSGRQVALQPPSAKSDRRFTGRQTIFAGSAAHDRGGNERAVRVCKRCGLAKRGFLPGMCATRLNNAWRAFGFRANFMYEPVL